MKYWVWLSSLNTLSPITRLKLLNHFDEPKNIWNASENELKEINFLTDTAIKEILNNELKKNADIQLNKLNKLCIKIVTIKDEEYPVYLKNIYDPPVVLYTKGSIKNDEKSIAIVGSRKATSYGFEMGEELACRLASFGITITSGMARGIDTSAHKGALAAKGRTIAVLGCGHDIIYPPENKVLMECIINSGAVISEYLPGTAPIQRNFPARNRIISGLSFGVIIVEAAANSGSLITADFALEQGREVFAVPGDIKRPNSAGANKLIQQGAKLITCAGDVLEELKSYLGDDPVLKSFNQITSTYNGLNNQTFYGNLSSEELCIVENLNHEPLNTDMLIKRTGYNIKIINAILTMLELKGIVEQIEGKMFKLKK